MKKKTLLALLCSVLLVSSAALGSIAFLTDSATITNHFTVGNVSMKLDETKVDVTGQPVPDPDGNPARTEEGNEYHLLPGRTYVKDPTVTLDKNSESSYVRLLVTLTKASELGTLCQAVSQANAAAYPLGNPLDHVKGYDDSVWQLASQSADTAANTITYELRYFNKAENSWIVMPDGTNDLVLEPLFTSITVPGELTGDQLKSLEGFEIKVLGQAIQDQGFQSVDEAWAAFPQEATASADAEPTEQAAE